MREVLRKAIEGIKRKPYSFLYDRDVQRAFRHIQSFRDGMDENSDGRFKRIRAD